MPRLRREPGLCHLCATLDEFKQIERQSGGLSDYAGQTCVRPAAKNFLETEQT
jgi:hypothetical protein